MDDLGAPLGRKRSSSKFNAGAVITQAVAGLLFACLVGFGFWIAIADDPLGGEPVAIASTKSNPTEQTAKGTDPAPVAAVVPPPSAPVPPPPAPATGHTVTIIDGKSGKREEVVLPGGGGAQPGPAAYDQKLVENSRHGLVPKIANDGTRPADAYARRAGEGKNDSARIALVLTGLGVSSRATDNANKLPGAVTLAFSPYANDLPQMVSRARAEGHEVVIQVPMEPFDYPDNDPGPQTLLTSLSAEQNLDRLLWALSRAQGYVGISNLMGARFSASEPALAPVLRESAKRGLIYLDDNAGARSVAPQMAGPNNLSFGKVDVAIDAVPSIAEIDKSLAKLESLARERGGAIGSASALPVSIERLAKWAKAAQARGITLVPLSAITAKPKSS